MNAQSSTPSNNPPSVKSPKRRSSFASFLNFILILGIIATIGLFVWAEQQRRATEAELRQTVTQLEEVRASTQEGGQALAEQVLGQLRQHMDIPIDPQPTVATIVDIDALREANEFYSVAENGDHLIITERRAILYDPDRDIILDVVPVTLNQEATTPAPDATSDPTEPDSDANPSPTAAASPSPDAAQASPSPNQ